MPELEQYFHYRNIDVSTIKELARRWAPELALLSKKKAGTAPMTISENQLLS